MNRRDLRRVGHKGADLIAPGNTYESFDAALAAGVDMIEFDVLIEAPERWRGASRREAERVARRGQGELVLAHDWGDAKRRVPHTLEQGLEHLASARFSAVELNIDLKLPGYEHRVLDALRRYELLDRALISTQYRESLALIRQAEPAVRLGWSVPKLRRDPFQYPVLFPATVAGLYGLKAAMPWLAARALRSGACDALMAHWRLVTPTLVRAVSDAGGELYVWTVDQLAQIQALERLGVTGVITNDPRLFGPWRNRAETPDG